MTDDTQEKSPFRDELVFPDFEGTNDEIINDLKNILEAPLMQDNEVLQDYIKGQIKDLEEERQLGFHTTDSPTQARYTDKGKPVLH